MRPQTLWQVLCVALGATRLQDGEREPDHRPSIGGLIIGGIMKIFGHHEPATLAQFENVRTNAVDAALMADGHVGYVMPIGGVATYRNQVSVPLFV